jgi:saccharopine dehydrogenase-like NADP-dependent oxidoreductase
MRDMIILSHLLSVTYVDGDRPAELITSTLVAEGEPGGFTAMARTVGLPTAVAAKLLLQGELSLTGTHLPTHPSVYEPILRELQREGLKFSESVSPLPPDADHP